MARPKCVFALKEDTFLYFFCHKSQFGGPNTSGKCSIGSMSKGGAIHPIHRCRAVSKKAANCWSQQASFLSYVTRGKKQKNKKTKKINHAGERANSLSCLATFFPASCCSSSRRKVNTRRCTKPPRGHAPVSWFGSPPSRPEVLPC